MKKLFAVAAIAVALFIVAPRVTVVEHDPKLYFCGAPKLMFYAEFNYMTGIMFYEEDVALVFVDLR